MNMLLLPLISLKHNMVESTPTEQKAYFSDRTLRELGVFTNGEKVQSTSIIFDSGMRGESWIYGYAIQYQDANGNSGTKYLKEKNILSSGFCIEAKTQEQGRRMVELTELGIPVPHTYAIKGGTIYQDFIPEDRTTTTLSSIEGLELNDNTRCLLNQLVDMGARLDSAGFAVADFLRELIFDYNQNQFLFMDFGFDLGTRSNTSSQYCLRTLLRRFPQNQEYIKNAYGRYSRKSEVIPQPAA